MIIFSAVRNFRNYVSEKVLVFVILECGLYHEQNGIYACKNAVETCWKHGDMILRYLLIFFFSHILLKSYKNRHKILADWASKMSSACGNCLARACYDTQFTYKS